MNINKPFLGYHMMAVLVTGAMSNYVLQGNSVMFSWLGAVQSIFISTNNRIPKLKLPILSEDKGTISLFFC